MNHFLWLTTRWIKNLGLPGLAGLALVGLSLAGYFAIIVVQHSRLEQLSHDLVSEQTHLSMSRLNPQGDTHTPGAQLLAFYDFFPAREKAPKLFHSIFSAAHNESVSLAQGEYKYSHGKAGRIGIYQVSLPVKGSYVQIRKFIVKVLNSMPSAALDELSFKRDSIGRIDLEAKIRFSIYLSDF